MKCRHGEDADVRYVGSEGKLKAFCNACQVRLCPCCLYPYPKLSASADALTPNLPAGADAPATTRKDQ